MTIARGTDKTDLINGKIDWKGFVALNLPPHVYGGFTSDHKALGEGRVAAKEAVTAAAASGVAAPAFTIESADMPHKHSLNGKHRMEAASGASAGLGDNHWRQMLVMIRFLFLSDAEKMTALAIEWLGEDVGPHTLVPPDPEAGRWMYVAYASKRFHLVRSLRRKSTGEPFFLNYYRHLADLALPPNIRKNCESIALMSVDPRVLVFTMFEMEYLKMVHQPALRKVYELTRQGWSGQF
jgi:hypothetical protein